MSFLLTLRMAENVSVEEENIDSGEENSFLLKNMHAETDFFPFFLDGEGWTKYLKDF